MKKIIVGSLVMAFVVVLFSSFEAGVTSNGYNCTGSNGSTGSCSDASNGCHSSQVPSNLVLSIIMTDSAGNTFSSGYYVPGSLYRVTLHGSLASGGAPYPVFGFQFTTGVTNDGSFTLTNSYLKSTTYVGGPEYIEQKMSIPTTASNVFETYFFWQAPPAGAGTIKFYATLLAANDDHTAQGDIDKNTYITLPEIPVNSVQDFDENTAVILAPNPFSDVLQLSITTRQNKQFQLQVFNLSGQQIFTENIEANSTTTAKIIPTQSWGKGLYFVTITDGKASRTMKIVKS